MTGAPAVLAIEPLGAPPDADISVPGSKSITNRALVVAGLAAGRSTLRGALDAADTRAMADALTELGVSVEQAAPDVSVVTGVEGRIAPGPRRLQFAQSGTTARFLVPAVASGWGEYVLDGSEQLRARPFDDLIAAMRSLGVTVVEDGLPGQLPLTVTAAGGVEGGTVRLAADVSSQFASGLLLSGPAMSGGLRLELTTDVVSEPYLEMTAAVMSAFGAQVARADEGVWVVSPGGYTAADYQIEPDASGASYFFAAAALTGGRVRVERLGTSSIQGDARFVDFLEQMGAEVTRGADSIEVRGTGRLTGIDVDLRHVSDTAPTLAVVAAQADGPTRITGIGFIRGKESDRIAAVVTELRRCGVDASETADGLVVHPGPLAPARVETYDDHRIAMSFALLGLVADGIEIVDPGCVVKTFPDYFERLDGLRSPQNDDR